MTRAHYGNELVAFTRKYSRNKYAVQATCIRKIESTEAADRGATEDQQAILEANRAHSSVTNRLHYRKQCAESTARRAVEVRRNVGFPAVFPVSAADSGSDSDDDESQMYDVDKIIKHRARRTSGSRKRGYQYLVRWEGYEEETWEPESSFPRGSPVLAAYWQSTRSGRSSARQRRRARHVLA